MLSEISSNLLLKKSFWLATAACSAILRLKFVSVGYEKSCWWNCISQSQMLHHVQVRPDYSVKQLMGSRLEWEKEQSKSLAVVNDIAYLLLSTLLVQDYFFPNSKLFQNIVHCVGVYRYHPYHDGSWFFYNQFWKQGSFNSVSVLLS